MQRRQRQRQRQRQLGASLMTTIIGTGVIAAVAGVLSQRLTAVRAVARHDELRDELTSFKDYLSTHLDCRKTLTGQACAPGHFFPLVDTDGRKIGTGGSGTWSLGGWSFRASCGGGAMNLEMSRLAPDGSTVKDQETGQAYDWTHMNGKALATLYGKSSFTCGAYFKPTKVPAGCTTNPSQTVTLCATTVSQPLWCIGPPNNSWYQTVFCPAGQMVASCGMTTGGANPVGGHYTLPVSAGTLYYAQPNGGDPANTVPLPNGYWACLCDMGYDPNPGVADCTKAYSMGAVHPSASCQAVCMAPP